MKALVLTYHVMNSKRKGGFHDFISFLNQDGYEIDWVTSTMSSTWLFRNDDRENPYNFFKLWKGHKVIENGNVINHFAVPVFIPARIAKKFRMKVADHYWPSWNKLRHRLSCDYDVILVEGVGCQYGKEIRGAYPNAKIIYRPSDVLKSFSNAKTPELLEREMIDASDITFCVDENQRDYYGRIGANVEKLAILRNPLCTTASKSFLETYMPPNITKKTAIYIGTSFVDLNLLEKAAAHFPDVVFVVVGPFSNRSHDNVVYKGALAESEYRPLLERAWVGLSPLTSDTFYKSGNRFGYTRKIIQYMQYLLPIVATYSSNYMNADGFFTADSEDEFLIMLGEALSFSLDRRINLREDYLRIVKEFDEETVRNKLLETCNR